MAIKHLAMKHWFLVTSAVLAIGCAQAAVAQAAGRLAGQVTSADEGAMEGVVVSAKKDGSTIAISVISDASGNFTFPDAKLEPGRYTLSTRAIGFDLDGPKTVDVAEAGAPVAIKLRKAGNLANQLTSGEWMASFPGTPQQKRKEIRERTVVDGERLRPRAEFLASINLSSAPQWQYPLKPLPRLKGRSTKVVITEYGLPRSNAMPHDVILDEQGMAWYTDFGHQFLGKLDPKSGKVTEYTVPMLKPDYPTGMLDIQLKDGDIWLGLMLQGGIAKFDRKTEKFTMFPLPKEINNPASQQAMVMPMSSHVDGKVWMNSVGIPGVHRVELATLKFETFEPFKDLPRGTDRSVYGIKADSQNNLFFMDFSSEYIGRIDAKTGKFGFYKTPTPNSNPRRGYMDPQDRLWFTEYRANKLAMFDTKAETFTEWEMPTPLSYPYDVIPDRNGELWTAGMANDRVVRLDPKTGQATEYQLPKSTNVRRVWVDNSTTPVTFWVGSNHGASIVKVEPLD
jgi:virginiamycin B lyase